MKTKLLGILGSMVLGLGLPALSSAAPMNWNYSGVCTAGDCDVVPTVTGSISGDPTLFGSNNQLNEYVLWGDLFSYEFSIGDYHFSGTRGSGSYTLDASGNIVGGSMTFGDLFSLEFLGVGSATWSFSDTDCKFFVFCRTAVEASGQGGYTTTASVPEPATLTLLGLGLLGIGAGVRKRRA